MAEDRAVWEGILRRDAAVFDAFYQEQAPRLLAFLRVLVGDRQTAEDLAQETFVQLWTRPQRYEPDRGRLRAYLFGIGRKRAAEWWRQRKTSEPLPEEKDGWCGVETSLIMADAFQALSQEQRSLLWLREVEGQSYAELGVILEIPVGTVRSRLFTAREALRKVWQVGRTALEKEQV